jgi:ATP-dependent Clp endopeptidase proteolytic subunit ClpP
VTDPVPNPVKEAAEAEKFLAEAKAAAELATKTYWEGEKFKHESEYAALDVQVRRINLAREQEKRNEELTANKHHHVYLFNGTVDAASAKSCADQLVTWQRLAGEVKPSIEIIFNSPGGSIVAGLALWDTIQAVRAAGHYVTTTSYGMAASMAGILLQAGDNRVMGKESWLLIHEAAFSAGGKIGEVEDTVKWVKMVQERILNIFANRSTVSKATIKRKWTRQDWWLSSDEALKLGLCDEVR